MRIWLVASGYPTEQDPLHEIFPFDQAKALIEAGHEVTYFAIDLRSIRHRRAMGRHSLTVEGVPVKRADLPLGRVPYGMLDRVGFRSFERLAAEAGKTDGLPDIIHAHSAEAARYVAASNFRRWQAPFLITEHWSAVHQINPASELFRRMAKTYNQADRVIAVSGSLARVINEYFKVPVEIIPNLLDLEVFGCVSADAAAKAANHISDQGPFEYVSTGHLIKGKGMDLLLSAFAAAFSDDPLVTLTLFGEGDQREKLKQQARRLAIGDRVSFRGRVSRSELAAAYREAQAFVLASRSETFGVAYLEALASGLPVIATRCGGPEDFVNERNGLFVPGDDIPSLTAALQQMRTNVTSYDPAAISRETVAHFSGEKIVSRLEALYQRVLTERSDACSEAEKVVV